MEADHPPESSRSSRSSKGPRSCLVGVMLLMRRTSDDLMRWARQRFAFVAGCMGFLIVLAAFLELAGWRGMGIVAAAFTYFLVRWYHRTPAILPAPGPAAASLPASEPGSGLARGSAR